MLLKILVQWSYHKQSTPLVFYFGTKQMTLHYTCSQRNLKLIHREQIWVLTYLLYSKKVKSLFDHTFVLSYISMFWITFQDSSLLKYFKIMFTKLMKVYSFNTTKILYTHISIYLFSKTIFCDTTHLISIIKSNYFWGEILHN